MLLIRLEAHIFWGLTYQGNDVEGENGPDRSRTDMPVRATDFESVASANSATGPNAEGKCTVSYGG